jgi:hypothetical protein
LQIKQEQRAICHRCATRSSSISNGTLKSSSNGAAAVAPPTPTPPTSHFVSLKQVTDHFLEHLGDEAKHGVENLLLPIFCKFRDQNRLLLPTHTLERCESINWSVGGSILHYFTCTLTHLKRLEEASLPRTNEAITHNFNQLVGWWFHFTQSGNTKFN